MAEGCLNSGTDLNTLEEILSGVGEPCLLQDLDTSLMHVRQHKKTKEDHLQCLKLADRQLLKLSIRYHPDRIVRTDKPDIAEAHQKVQTALNAARTVLKALTEVFLEYIDIDYKYEFFSELKTDWLLNDKERSLLIGKMSRGLGRMTEVKQEVVIREIREFLLVSRKSIKGFLQGDVAEFVRYRDYAVYRLEKCLEGYKTLSSECSELEKEWKDSHCVKMAIRKACQQNDSESNLLRELLTATRRSIGGTFLIFSISGPTDEVEYSVLPFAYYVFILLMCTLMVNRRIYIKGKNFPIEAPYYRKEPDLYLRAYYLACHFNDRNLCSYAVERILGELNLPVNQDSVVEAFRDNLVKIDRFLSEEFKIDHYDAGKSREERFCDRLTRLTEAVTEFENVGKDLSAKISQCRLEYEEIRRADSNTQNEKE